MYFYKPISLLFCSPSWSKHFISLQLPFLQGHGTVHEGVLTRLFYFISHSKQLIFLSLPWVKARLWLIIISNLQSVFAIVLLPHLYYKYTELASRLMLQCCIILCLVYAFYDADLQIWNEISLAQMQMRCLQHMVLSSWQAVGMLYLHEVLKPIINRIFDEKKYIELDPCKIDLNRTR